MRNRVRFYAATLLALVAVMLASTAAEATISPFAVRTLTPDQGDTYSITQTSGTVTMQAPSSNVSTNLRQVFWPRAAADVTDGRVCATWTSQSADSIQEGLAFHIVAGASSTRAITVTKNIVYGIYWVFNVHTWDSSAAQPFVQVHQFDMGPVVTENAAFVPFPWRACARMIGSILQFKLWVPSRESEPTWSDATHAGSTTVPVDYLTPGKLGWYVGHIPPGGVATYQQLSAQ